MHNHGKLLNIVLYYLTYKKIVCRANRITEAPYLERDQIFRAYRDLPPRKKKFCLSLTTVTTASQKCKTTSKGFSYNNNLKVTNQITADDFHL